MNHNRSASLPAFRVNDLRLELHFATNTSTIKHLPKYISPNTPGLGRKNDPKDECKDDHKDAYSKVAFSLTNINGEKLETPSKLVNKTPLIHVCLLWSNVLIFAFSILCATVSVILRTVPIELPCFILFFCAISGLIFAYSYKTNIIKISALKRIMLQYISKQKLEGTCTRISPKTGAKNTYVNSEDMEQMSLLSSFRKGAFHKQLAICSTEDLKQLLPVVAQSLCQLPFGLTEFRSALFVILAHRISEDATLDQTWRFFLNSNRDIPDIIRIWEDHEYFQSEDTVENQHDDIDVMPSDTDLNSVLFFRSLFKDLNKIGSKKRISRKQLIYDPINGQKLIQVQLKKIMPSNAKPYLLDCYTTDKATNTSDNLDDMYTNPKWSSTILLKSGDDLRKDLGVQLMFKFMNELWKESGLNYHGQRCETLVYNVVPMSVDFGAIEFVEDTTKISNIDSVIMGIHSSDQLRTTMDNLIATGAASYVASYILGVRDRHHDNILVCTDGRVFNIDFSHILGEKLGGLDAAKVAIPHRFVKVLGNENWNRFIEVAVLCFNVLRKNYFQLLDFARIVFAFMKTTEENERYLKHSLMIDIDDMESLKKIRAKFCEAPSKLSTRMKNTIHTLAVMGRSKSFDVED